MRRVLIANRGEIAVRLIGAVRDLGLTAVAVASSDDDGLMHTRLADECVVLPQSGPRAYLDIDAVIAAATSTGCDAVHPGYGFLSENAEFARRCESAGLTFIGPTPDVLDLFGDKVRARQLARDHEVPLLPGTAAIDDVAEAQAFFDELPHGAQMIIKAVGGGGGRGMRVIADRGEIADALDTCRREADGAFGRAEVYLERYLPSARHIEIQVVGDGTGDVVHLGERECSIQRSHQKIVEFAPCPGMPDALLERIATAALSLAAATRYRGLGTFEFLVDASTWGPEAEFFFIEANPRLQVEHTVTEMVTGVDLVDTQIRLLAGASLADVGLARPVAVSGLAVQARVNIETLLADGSVRPAAGHLHDFVVPGGPGVRVDTFGEPGIDLSPRYDSLLAKVIVHHPSGDLPALCRRAERALAAFRIDGVDTNLAVLRRILTHPDLAAGRITTGFIADHVADLLPSELAMESADGGRGTALDMSDPLAVLQFGKGEGRPATGSDSGRPVTARRRQVTGPAGTVPVLAELQGTVVSIECGVDSPLAVGGVAMILESMKMEHVVTAPTAGIVRAVAVAPGETVLEGEPLFFVEPADVDADAGVAAAAVDLDHIRPDLAEMIAHHAHGLDENRPEAVAKRHGRGNRTARENIADLVDDGSFVEYGALMVAAQRARHSLDHLQRNTPHDGMVAGIGTVNADRFGADRAGVVVVSYDYMVLAGTQGHQNHRKKDRIFEVAERQRLPVVLFAEGGGGRPGDTDGLGVAGLDCLAFLYFGKLSGLVPLVGITNGYCFAGNAALLGACDVVIATKGSNIGLGGPAMVEGGGLGVYTPDEIGPVDVQVANGVIDILVEDEAEAVAVTKQYLSYFQGPIADWECVDQRRLRSAIPENRLRVYDVRAVIEDLCDVGSVLEVRRGFGVGIITALARIEGRTVGVVANNPHHLGGALDADACDKSVRFQQLCDAYDIPIVFLCDTPGFMVGPASEAEANVRHAGRLFVNGANLTVPFFTVVLRKGYGLGAQAMAGGSFHAPVFTISWPTGEFGGMGLEGAVKLGYRNELAAIEDPAERRALYETMVAKMYEVGKAVSMARAFEIDAVIDPADTRRWIMSGLAAWPHEPFSRGEKKRACIDAW
jgi:acetyl/propionyl-CoA carboxylase alpha subunit